MQTANLATHLKKIISPLLFTLASKAMPHLKGHTNINFPKKYFTPWKPIILHWKNLQDTFSHNLYKNSNIKCDLAIIIIGLSLKFKKNFFL